MEDILFGTLCIYNISVSILYLFLCAKIRKKHGGSKIPRKFFLRLNHLKRVFNNRNSESGFSLAEVLIAAAILGGLSLVLAQISKDQAVIQKKAEASFEITTISNLISQTLLNQTACSSTLGAGNVMSNGMPITLIKNRIGAPIFNTTSKYGNKSVMINSMTLKNLTLSNVAGSNKYGEANIDIKFEKTSKLIKGVKSITKSFPIRIEVDSSDHLIKCYSALENAVLTAKLNACGQIGGIFDTPTDQCSLKGFGATDLLSNSVAVSTQSQKDFFNNMETNILAPKYVDVAGDTMTGKLQVNNQIESNSKICISGKCRTFSEAPCPTGQVVRKIKEDGTVSCSNVTCPDPSTFFVGVNASGNPICKAFPTNTCSANQYVAKVNSDGSVVCANLPPGTNKNCSPGAIQRIDSSGNHHCVALSVNTNVFGKACSVGSSLRGFTNTGAPICDSLAPKWPEGPYCIIRSKVGLKIKKNCPSGFTEDQINVEPFYEMNQPYYYSAQKYLRNITNNYDYMWTITPRSFSRFQSAFDARMATKNIFSRFADPLQVQVANDEIVGKKMKTGVIYGGQSALTPITTYIYTCCKD